MKIRKIEDHRGDKYLLTLYSDDSLRIEKRKKIGSSISIIIFTPDVLEQLRGFLCGG